MMLLVLLVLILVAPYAALKVLGSLVPTLALTPVARGRISLSLFFTLTGIGHFIKGDLLASMLPAWFPAPLAVVYLTGILELLGAIGIWIPRLRRLTGICLIVMLIGFLPANIYAAVQRLPFAGHEIGPVYLLARVPIQLLLIIWTYLVTTKSFRPERSEVEEPRG